MTDDETEFSPDTDHSPTKRREWLIPLPLLVELTVTCLLGPSTNRLV
jgi:hypothetical protein